MVLSALFFVKKIMWMYNAININSMISRKLTFFLGIFIFLVPFMGLPTSWKTAVIIICGLVLITSSISLTISIPKKTVKHKTKKEKNSKISVEGIAVYPKDNIISDMVYRENKSKDNVIE